MNEILILAVCASGGPACSKASEAYVKTHPAMQERIDVLERQYGAVLAPAAPLLPLVQGRVRARLLGADLTIGPNKGTIIYEWRF